MIRKANIPLKIKGERFTTSSNGTIMIHNFINSLRNVHFTNIVIVEGRVKPYGVAMKTVQYLI